MKGLLSTMNAELPRRMIARADADGLPAEHAIRIAADHMTKVLDDPTVTIPVLIGTWAKTRKLWCAYSGEPLV